MILSNISTFSVLLWLAAAITASLGLIVYFGGSNRSSRSFLTIVISMAVWTASVGAFIASSDIATATFFVKMAYFSGTSAFAAFFYFFLVYPENKKPGKHALFGILILIAVNAYLYFYTGLIVSSAQPVASSIRYVWTFGPAWWIFYVVLYPLFLGGLFLLWKTTRRTSEIHTKRNLQYMFASVLVLIVPPTFLNVILPQFGYFDFIWLGPILSLGWVGVIAFSIAKYRQLDIRTFTSEILNVALVLIFFSNIFTGASGGVIGRVITFFIVLVISVYVIRLGTEIDDLNLNLQSKVKEQTKEIQGLYEVEKKARVELERLNSAKDEFIMVTQHHLRTPLTQIKYYLESFLERPVVQDDFRSEVTDALSATDRLNHILDNFLNIAQIQVGEDILSIAKISLLPIVEEAFNELAGDIDRMKLTVDYPKDAKAWPAVWADASKIKEAIFVVIQNTVSYNVTGGSISIKLETGGAGDKKMLKLIVADTGIGIEKQELDRLFKEKFNRGVEAAKSNPLGMGMGLTFAYYIVEAHHGTITLDSKGKGQGSEVVISLPLA